MSPDEARSRFASAPVARMATVGRDGAPHVVPVTFAVERDVIYTAIDAKPKRGSALRRLANIASERRVSLLVDNYDPDWRTLWWARADGTASVVDAGPALERCRTLLRSRYPQYGAVEIDGPAILIAVEQWSGWSAGD